MAALNLLEVLLNGPGTLERRLAINISLHVAAQANVFQPLKLELLFDTIRKMEALATIQSCVHTCCNSTFLFWHKGLISIYLKDIYDAPGDAARMHYLFMALRDTIATLRYVQETIKPPVNVLEHFQKEILGQFDAIIANPLYAKHAHTPVRKHTHTHTYTHTHTHTHLRPPALTPNHLWFHS